MVNVIAQDIYACEDCTLLIANGSDAPEGTEEFAYDSFVFNLMNTEWGEHAGHLVIDCQDDEDSDYLDPDDFKGYDATHKETIVTPYRCDACGRMMHGEFHAIVVFDS